MIGISFPPVAMTGNVQSLFGAVNSSASAGSGDGFAGVLKSALNQVSGMQSDAQQQVSSLLSGGNADLNKVMVSVEKADVAFQLMMQVRNKIVNAYQDIEKMQF